MLLRRISPWLAPTRSELGLLLMKGLVVSFLVVTLLIPLSATPFLLAASGLALIVYGVYRLTG